MALDRLNYASGGERTDFSGMMSLLSYFSLKLNLYAEKKKDLFYTAQDIKRNHCCHLPVFSSFSVHLPTCPQHGKD